MSAETAKVQAMVEPIGAKAVTTQDRLVVPVAASAQTAKAAAQPSEAAAKQLELSALAFDFGKQAPVESKRVEHVRDGSYPLFPETIADRMLALKLYWSPKK
jgi:negative regulator of flagellin synthesis FlgM